MGGRRGDSSVGVGLEGLEGVIRLEGTITYQDGTREPIVVTQREYAAFELWALRHGLSAAPDQAPPMLMMRFLGYAAHYHGTGEAPSTWPPFEEWAADDVTLETPEGVDGNEAGADARPFQKAAWAE